MQSQIFSSDFLVIGSGIAGLTFAIEASKLGSVHIVTKKREYDSNTNYAQGGIASVIAPDDSFDMHINDTLQAGAGLCNKRAVEILVKEGPARIAELINWGAQFSYQSRDKGLEGLDLGREGGHSHNRIIHANDLTGQQIEKALLNKIANTENIKIFQDHTAVDLLTEHQLGIETSRFKVLNKAIHCYGAYILDDISGAIHTFNAKITFLATGGLGQVYLHTTNPPIATGDGIAMAYRAGALIADMEFIQFHPTTLYSKKTKKKSFLISEAVRGEGAILKNIHGKEIMKGVHPLENLAPRDVVARTIDKELKKSGDPFVYLDITHKDADFLKQRFPNIYANCLEEGIDITKDPIPVVPAAHYLCGGIISDINGKSSIENLYVSGESACTGVHGANRLASNSLLEAVVFSHRAYLKIKNDKEQNKLNCSIPDFPFWDKEGTFDLNEWILVKHNLDDIKRLMWDYVGIVRTDQRLEQAAKRIKYLSNEIENYYKKSTITWPIIELRNLATVAKLIIDSAKTRSDSIGLHCNIDHLVSSKTIKNVVLQNKFRPKYKKWGVQKITKKSLK